MNHAHHLPLSLLYSATVLYDTHYNDKKSSCKTFSVLITSRSQYNSTFKHISWVLLPSEKKTKNEHEMETKGNMDTTKLTNWLLSLIKHN